jgi:hypothetical protein
MYQVKSEVSVDSHFFPSTVYEAGRMTSNEIIRSESRGTERYDVRKGSRWQLII